MSKEKTKSCEHCNANCCKYVVIELDTPKTIKDFENIKWYVAHKNVNVFIEDDGSWNVEFLTPCSHLNSKTNKCTNYEHRPKICREYDHDECTFHNIYKEEFTFKSIKDVDDYVEKVFKKGLHKTKKRSK